MKLKVLTLEGLSTFKSALLSLFTKEQIGLSNVENKSSEEIREEITYENVVNALGYAPASKTMEVPMVSFSISDGDLIANYPDGASAPNFYIDGNGDLLFFVND